MSLTQTLTPYTLKDFDFLSQSSQIMSITGYQDRAKTYNKKSVHHRNDSDELDVFEAARYFSGYNDTSTNYSHTQERIVKEDTQDWRKPRISLEKSPMRKTPVPKASLKIEKQVIEKKYNVVPGSPGGKLARFLNSLFSQTGHKTKKSKSSTQSVKDVGEGGRRRRSSISNFRSSSSTTGCDTQSLYNSSSTTSGFRTPPVFAQTTSKNFRSISDHKQLDSNDEKRKHDLSWLAEKDFSFIVGSTDNRCSLPKLKKDEPTKFSNVEVLEDDDDGAESDSSSDLFELGTCSSGLPVYETTHMNKIKI